MPSPEVAFDLGAFGDLADAYRAERRHGEDGPASEHFAVAAEIRPGCDGAAPRALLETIYALSEFVLVALILDGLTPKQVDRALDDVVSRFPLDIPGVRYISATETASVSAAVAQASLLVGGEAFLSRAPSTPRTDSPNGTHVRCPSDRPNALATAQSPLASA